MTTTKIAAALAAVCCTLPATASAGAKPSIAPGSKYENTMSGLTITVKVKRARSVYVSIIGYDVSQHSDGTCSRKHPLRSAKLRMHKAYRGDRWQVTVIGKTKKEKRFIAAMSKPLSTFIYTARNASGSTVSRHSGGGGYPC